MNNFSSLLIGWYKEHKRDLPWRGENDPYKIWISEIILQQTRIEQGRAYYLRFVEQLPDIQTLANASEDEILKLWQGLGYYSRARNLQAGAKFVVENFNGVFPNTYEDIRKIKGIGDYTAAAIASMAFRLPYAAVDGNAYRVLSRVFGITTPINSTAGKKEFQLLAQEVLDKHEPDIFNQAMMDFGATHCKAKNPQCDTCPFEHFCYAKEHQQQSDLPQKLQKITIKNRFLHYFFLKNGENTYIQKRSPNDIWAGLYEFPLLETTEPADFDILQENAVFQKFFKGCSFVLEHNPFECKHQLTHQTIFAKFYTLTITDKTPKFSQQTIMIPIADFDQYPVSRLMNLFFEKMMK